MIFMPKWQWNSLKNKSHFDSQAYGEVCMSRTQCYERFKHFKHGRMSVGDDSDPGWHVWQCRESLCCNVEIAFNCSRSWLWNGHQRRIIPSNCTWENSGASCQDKIVPRLLRQSESGPCWNQPGTDCHCQWQLNFLNLRVQLTHRFQTKKRFRTLRQQC